MRTMSRFILVLLEVVGYCEKVESRPWCGAVSAAFEIANGNCTFRVDCVGLNCQGAGNIDAPVR